MSVASAPQNGIDTGPQFAQMKGLRYVIIGAELETDDAIDDIVRLREHQDGYVALRPKPPRDGKPVLAWHVDIENHEIGHAVRDDRVELSAPRRSCNGKVISVQILGDHGAKLWLVVDDDDTLPSSHGGFA